MKKACFLFAISCLGFILASPQRENDYVWPPDYIAHVRGLQTTDKRISSLSEAVNALHNHEMREAARTDWLQTQVDLIIKYVDDQRARTDKINDQIRNMQQQNGELKAELLQFQKAACPILLNSTAADKERTALRRICRE